MPSEEILDLVDENDQVIDSKPRSEVHANKLRNFRAINAFLINNEGKLWIPRRTKHKALFPLGLDCSVAGHVTTGETYDEAFAREMEEEIRLDVKNVKTRFIGHFTPHQHNMSAFVKIYEICYNDVPQYNPDDFCEYYWLTPQEVLDRIDAGDYSKSDLPKLIKLIFTNADAFYRK